MTKKERIINLAKLGMTAKQIAETVPCTNGYVSTTVAGAGIILRRNGVPDPAMIKMYHDGRYSRDWTHHATGISYYHLNKWANDNGVEWRKSCRYETFLTVDQTHEYKRLRATGLGKTESLLSVADRSQLPTEFLTGEYDDQRSN